eukprot:gene7992-2798_t
MLCGSEEEQYNLSKRLVQCGQAVLGKNNEQRKEAEAFMEGVQSDMDAQNSLRGTFCLAFVRIICDEN